MPHTATPRKFIGFWNKLPLSEHHPCFSQFMCGKGTPIMPGWVFLLLEVGGPGVGVVFAGSMCAWIISQPAAALGACCSFAGLPVGVGCRVTGCSAWAAAVVRALGI